MVILVFTTIFGLKPPFYVFSGVSVILHVELQEISCLFCINRLWVHVSEAIQKGDQQMATHEKFIVEEAQRKAAKDRELTMQEWMPRLFERNPISEEWLYKYIE